MSQVVRYVHISHGNVTVKESFVDLIRLEGKTAAVLTEQILNKLKCDDLDVANLRGQGYDRYFLRDGRKTLQFLFSIYSSVGNI